MEVTSELALPVIGTVPEGTVTIGGGNSVGGVGTPLNVGVTGENDVAGAVDVIVTPLVVAVAGVVIVAGTVVVAAVVVTIVFTLVPLNCAATGNDVNVPPLKASATTPIGTSELINNNPVSA